MNKRKLALILALATLTLLTSCDLCIQIPARARIVPAPGIAYTNSLIAALEAGKLVNDGVEWDYVEEGDAYDEGQEAAEGAGNHGG